ncbi:MAG: ArsS family sensor histidine kinase [Campylobacterota bacterium]|nr:ArsS family sensor histidine kinase [Campylobacterota bacterium]
MKNIKQHAVFITVFFALAVTLVSVTYVFIEFYKLNKQQYVDNIFAKQSVVTQIYRDHNQKKSSDVMLEANLAVYKLFIEKETYIIDVVINNAKILKSDGFKTIKENFKYNNGVFASNKSADLKASMMELYSKIYFYIQTPETSILIRDEELKPYRPWNLLYSYATIIFVIVMSFFMILQKLRPLILLRRKIADFGDGDLSISFKVNGSDEIALVSNELEATKEKINTILESRTLFLRNLMHELKTPIAKGTIATQMLKSDKQRNRFTSIFSRLESLVREFALIEEVTSIGDKNDFKEYRLVDVIDGAIDMAMIEKTSICIDIPAGQKIKVNYNLYTIAIKNMIDNGIKYSTDSKVKISMINGEFLFESKGERISHPLSYYIEPFTKDNPAKNSFGLGLYLVDSILKAHEQVLAHQYNDGVNCFVFA